MSSPPTINRFKGTGWEECNEFILAIRAVAWKEGKFRDLAWVADFAALHFSHKALTWHSRLPQDVRDDWAKLQVALLERWTPPEDEDEPRNAPMPAAAPSVNRSDKDDRPLQGVLKIVIDGSDTNSYIKFGTDGRAETTNEGKEALRFRCSSLSNATILERIDGTRHSLLGVQWRATNPDLKKGSIAYGYSVLVDPIRGGTSWGPVHPYQVASCTISADGEVIQLWENDDSSKVTLGTFCGGLGGVLFIAADPEPYSKHYTGEKRAKLFIEPID